MRDATWTCLVGYGIADGLATGLGVVAAQRGQWMTTTALLFVVVLLSGRMVRIVRTLRCRSAS